MPNSFYNNMCIKNIGIGSLGILAIERSSDMLYTGGFMKNGKGRALKKCDVLTYGFN